MHPLYPCKHFHQPDLTIRNQPNQLLRLLRHFHFLFRHLASRAELVLYCYSKRYCSKLHWFFPEIELINLIIEYRKLSLPVRMNPIRLPDLLFPSEFEISYRTFLMTSGEMLSNFSCWRGLCQIGHLLNLRSLYYKIFEF